MPNTCAVTYAIIQRSTGLEGLRLDLIARLAVLRLQSPDLYAAVIRDPDLLAALEMACRGKRQNSLDRAFGSERAAWMMETAEEFRGTRIPGEGIQQLNIWPGQKRPTALSYDAERA